VLYLRSTLYILAAIIKEGVHGTPEIGQYIIHVDVNSQNKTPLG